MQKKVRKAVIPAAGLGTRFLPATKAQPKEMLPIVDKPTLQYIIEEAVASGIEEILIITGRNKKSIEDHFDKSVELELELENKGKQELLEIVQNISNMINIHYIRQKEPKGLGDAIYCARHFIGDEPFAVMLGDDIVDNEVPCLKQLMNAYEEYRTTILGVQTVDAKDTDKYGIIGAKYIDYNLQVKYDTLSREAVKRQIELENMAEEMRVLYVALTRAKEKLFITGVVKNYEEKLEKLEKRVLLYEKQKEKINPLLVKFGKSYLDWLFLVILYEKDKNEVFNLNVIDKEECLKNIKKAEDAITQKENYNLEDIKNTKESEQKDLERIENILEYKYPYYEASKIKTKMSVTEIKELDNKNKSSIILENSKSNKNVQELLNVEEIKNPTNYQNQIDVDKTEEKNVNNFIVPKFIEKENKNIISSARKGTVMHLCMQKLDNKIEYDLKKVKDLVENLVIQNIITQEEAKSINLFKILDFTNSLIGKELKKAKKIYKEKPFYMNIDAKELYKEETEEKILVQGIIDLYYITKDDKLVLVDYKTDYVEKGKENTLVEKYEKQLELYQKALEEALNKKVDKKYIYSVYLGKEIEMSN